MARPAMFVVVALLVAAATVGSAPEAGAATVNVAIVNFAFDPWVTTAASGSTVTWTQDDADTQHGATSDQSFWDTGLLSVNQTRSETRTFKNAGTYGYHCEVHPFMTGKVRVPMSATGSATNGWTVRWSTAVPTPANRSFDVQIKRPGSTAWTSFRAGVTQRSVFFNPAKSGQYQFRSRTNNGTNAEVSDWSPTLTVTIA